MMRRLFGLGTAILLLLVSTTAVWAHGAESSVEINGGQITVNALFDTGERMENAQVVVYTPAEPETVWLSGVADGQGVYTFDIDQAQTGRWAVSIRTAGHGEILYLDVANDGTVSAETDNAQTSRTILAVVVVLLLAAVAYYFSRNNDSNNKGKSVPKQAQPVQS